MRTSSPGSQNRRRDSFRVIGRDLESLTQELNRVLGKIEERISQLDAIGQNPDVKGRTIANVARLSRLSLTVSDPPTKAEVESLTSKVNEILAALGAA